MPKTYTAKKFHYLYKTTNLVNGRYYFGMHSTNDLEDKYLGSGTLLRRSINKYGEENFRKEIIAFCSSREELVSKEHELIENYLGNVQCMNLKPGGRGGFCNEEHAKKFHAAGGRAVLQMLGKRHRERLKIDIEYRESYIDRLRQRRPSFLGKKHSEETKKKISIAHKGKGTGSNNSQFGTIWITNGTLNRKIKQTDTVPIGWKPGRVIKK